MVDTTTNSDHSVKSHPSATKPSEPSIVPALEETPVAQASQHSTSEDTQNESPAETAASNAETDEADSVAETEANEAELHEESDGEEEEYDGEYDSEEEEEYEWEDDDEEEENDEDVLSESTGGVDEYREGADGNIHLDEKQKSKIRELTQPDEADDIHLGFTKQGKPIVANPYYKYALRQKDGAEVDAPKTAPVTQPHTSRLTRRSVWEENAVLPMGPSMKLEKIKSEFCQWLSALGSKREMSVTKDRLEELFSLGLETNMIVRPPEVRMVRAGQPIRASHNDAPDTERAAQRGEHDERRTTSAAYCRSPSRTYYPELKRRWLELAMRDQMPTWQPAYHAVAPPPPRKIRYGHWYIPINKWTPLAGDKRLTPPETEQARQLRKRELQNLKLNQVLAKSHALTALREYIRLFQSQGAESAVPTPNMMRDVDALLAAEALEQSAHPRATHHRRKRTPKKFTIRLQGVAIGSEEDATQRSTPRRHTVYIKKHQRPSLVQDRGPLGLKPPPQYLPIRTAPGRAMSPPRRKSAKHPTEAARHPATSRTLSVRKTLSQAEKAEIDVLHQPSPNSTRASSADRK